MRKILVLLLTLVMLFTLCACEKQGVSNQTSSSATSYQNAKKTLTDNDINSAVSDALYNKINSQFPIADANRCTYKIYSTENEGRNIFVYGHVILNNKQGEPIGGYSDGSGSPIRYFTVKIDADTGRAFSCHIE